MSSKAKREPHCKVFKTLEEEQAHIKSHMLTVGKLIKWLKNFPEDTLVYAVEGNTGDWQELPSIETKGGNGYFSSLARCKKKAKEHLNHWYKNSAGGKKKVKETLDHMFQYTYDNGVMISC